MELGVQGLSIADFGFWIADLKAAMTDGTLVQKVLNRNPIQSEEMKSMVQALISFNRKVEIFSHCRDSNKYLQKGFGDGILDWD